MQDLTHLKHMKFMSATKSGLTKTLSGGPEENGVQNSLLAPLAIPKTPSRQSSKRASVGAAAPAGLAGDINSHLLRTVM